jgi:hypothetical protein
MSQDANRRDGVGVDFGTSNSLAAVHVDGRTHLVPLEHDTPVMPTADYLDRDRQVETGQAAIDRYIADNTGRTVELVPEVVGQASLLVGDPGANSRSAPETASQNVYGPAVTDLGLPGRLFRGLKRLLGDADTRRLMVFDHPYRIVALITPVLLRIRREIEAERGRLGLADPWGGLRVGHPVHFEGRDRHRDRTALTRLAEACGHAGLKAPVFYPEPVAATLSWRHEAGADHRGTALTVDFGGMELGIRPHMEIEEAFRQFAPYLDHVHAKDITGVIGNWNMCWFGGGMVNFARYAKALEAIGYDGYVCVEWEGWFKGGPGGVGDMDMPGLADMDRASQEAYEYLAPHFEKP